MKYIVSVSGGLGSAEALKRTIDTYGKENTIAVFADVKGDGSMPWLGMPTITTLLNERYGGESRDTYRFLWQLSYTLDIDIHRLEGWQTIWDSFYKNKAISPNATTCKGSEELKRERVAAWIESQGYQPGEYSVVLGMGWDEPHRIKTSSVWWFKRMGWPVPIVAPNAKRGYFAYIPDKDAKAIFCEYPATFPGLMFATNQVTALWCKESGCQIPEAYENGLEHNNCNKFCVLGGLTQWAFSYEADYEGYMWNAWMEYMWNRALGTNYTILKSQRADSKGRLSLYEFADKDTVEAQLFNRPNIHLDNYSKASTGACTCFSDIDLLRDYVSRSEPIKEQKALGL